MFIPQFIRDRFNGMPVGGGSGDTLRKASGSDFDTEWAAPSGGATLDVDSLPAVYLVYQSAAANPGNAFGTLLILDGDSNPIADVQAGYNELLFDSTDPTSINYDSDHVGEYAVEDDGFGHLHVKVEGEAQQVAFDVYTVVSGLVPGDRVELTVNGTGLATGAHLTEVLTGATVARCYVAIPAGLMLQNDEYTPDIFVTVFSSEMAISLDQFRWQLRKVVGNAAAVDDPSLLPGQPATVTGTPDSPTQATVTWATSSPAATDYRVTVFDDVFATVADVYDAASPHVFTGLITGTDYQVNVQPRNKYGYGLTQTDSFTTP